MADIFQGLPDLNTEAKIPKNIEVNTEGNRGTNLTDKDKTEPGLFDDLPEIKNTESKKQTDIFEGLKLPEENKKNSLFLKAIMSASPLTNIAEKTETMVEDIDGDSEQWKKVAYATQLGLFDTYRGVKQISGFCINS